MQQKKILIIFGGKSAEHEVSISSAYSILKAIDRNKFYPATIGITKEGKFIENVDPGALIQKREAVTCNSLKWTTDVNYWSGNNWYTMIIESDIIFPILHGPGGEDGTIQGMFEILGKKYVGSSVTGSAICIDKSIAKDLLLGAGLPTVPYFYFSKREYLTAREMVYDKVNDLNYPVYVKPTCLGSSVGISKVKYPAELDKAIEEALMFGDRIIIEKGVNGREVECSVLGNDYPKTSQPGEIIANADFYDYDSKYINDNADLMVPADLPANTIDEVRRLSVEAFRLLQCSGLARVDFFIENDTNRVLINEVNTMPGFTPISMYPKLWIYEGLTYKDLITELISLALKK